jgi:hypothetical protein
MDEERYAIRRDDGRWWMFDPDGRFDGGWVWVTGRRSVFKSKSIAAMWAARVGGDVVDLNHSKADLECELCGGSGSIRVDPGPDCLDDCGWVPCSCRRV